MYFTLLAYVFPIFQVLFPLYLLYNLWTADYRAFGPWLLDVWVTGGLLGLLFVAGRWDFVGYPLRYALYGPYAAVALLSALRFYERPLRFGSVRRWGQLADAAIVTGLLLWAGAGLTPDRPAIAIKPPLKGETHYVVQGGSTPPINYHGAFVTAQRHAVDINELNGWGARAAGLYPAALSDYAVYGDTVYSPVTGTVIRITDRFDDLQPPNTHGDHPAGNHIWMRRDSVYLLLAHLKHESVRVEPGQDVAAGQPVAQVGNTGNTSEPHLHVHAVTFDRPPAPRPDALPEDRTPVPLRFSGAYPTRNTTF
jgi:biotin carboxyl carrier protein